MNENINKEIEFKKDEEIKNLKRQIEEKNKKLEENKNRIKEFVKNKIYLDREKREIEELKEQLKKEKEKERDEFEKRIKEIKVVIKNEFSNVLKEKYEKELKEELQKYKNEFQKQFKLDNLEIMIKEYIESFQQKYKKLIEEKANSICKTIHAGVKCGKCSKEPIVGYRYKCYICDNFNLCENCEKENQISEEHKHDFIKIKNSQNMIYNNNQNYNNIKNENKPQSNIIIGNNTNINNNINKNKQNNSLSLTNFNLISSIEKNYSFECLNINNLKTSIIEEEDTANITINLLNNGKAIWPEGTTKLIFVEPSTFITEDIVLKPQRPGTNFEYKISFNNLKAYPFGNYNSFLRFNINEVNLGQKLKLTIEIKEK